MKLLPLACFAASTAQYSGDYEYGGVDASEDDRGYGYSSYGNYDDYGNKKKNKNNNSYSFGYDGGRAIGSGQAIAVALNCWPANFDTDTIMAQEAGEANPAERHAYGPLHLYGSEMNSLKSGGAFTGGTDPGLRSGLGGHYHYGHRHSGSDENSTPSEWAHYHSARHAGCLYEVDDFAYNAGSWNRIFHLWYYNGYYQAGAKGTSVAANLDSVIYDPNWVHFFNAHVLPSSGGGASTDPTSQSASNSIKLVMANPQYEGLGFLNFVSTYKNRAFNIGAAYREFADTTHVTNLGDISGTYSTYRAINSATAYQQTQGITGNYYFDAWMGTWELNMDDADTWTTTYDDTSSGTSFSSPNMAISSFPNNELGKDFRFNLRILLADSQVANRMMYYFYKINTIEIVFPEFVAYALVHDGRETTSSGTIMDGGSAYVSPDYAQGEGLYNVGQNNIRKNIIPPLDLASHFNNNGRPSNSLVPHENSPLTPEFHRVQGYLSTAAADVYDSGDSNQADFCRASADSGGSALNCDKFAFDCNVANFEEICSTRFVITGLLNTYSERLGGQRGTYQEIWVQLQYAYSRSNAEVDSTVDAISSPFPYLHFMAYQVSSVSFQCDTYNVINGNTCNEFAEYNTHDFGFGG